jgi:hypothetical protein
MTDEGMIERLRILGDSDAAERMAQLVEDLTAAVTIATQALNALHEVQTYKQPDDPDEENALTMHELDAFDFDVNSARDALTELVHGT